MKKVLIIILEDILNAWFLAYLSFFVLELIKEGVVSNYFDLNALLVFLVLLGVLVVVIKKRH